MDNFSKWVGRISQAVGYAMAPLCGIIALLVVYEVVTRYFLATSSSWTSEVENYLQIAMVMLGGAYCLHHGGHVRVDVLFRNFGAKGKAWVDIITAVMVLLASLPIMYFGFDLAWEALETGQTSVTAAEIILWPSMATVPLGFLLVTLQALANALQGFGVLAGRQGKEA